MQQQSAQQQLATSIANFVLGNLETPDHQVRISHASRHLLVDTPSCLDNITLQQVALTSCVTGKLNSDFIFLQDALVWLAVLLKC